MVLEDLCLSLVMNDDLGKAVAFLEADE